MAAGQRMFGTDCTTWKRVGLFATSKVVRWRRDRRDLGSKFEPAAKVVGSDCIVAISSGACVSEDIKPPLTLREWRVGFRRSRLQAV